MSTRVDETFSRPGRAQSLLRLSVVVVLSSYCQITRDKDKIPRNKKTKATARLPKTIFLFIIEVLLIRKLSD